MIREIVNYTRDLIEDIPDIMRWKNIPKRGLYVFIDIDKEGNWTNQNLTYGKDYTFADGKSEDFELSDDCKDFDAASALISEDASGRNKLGKFDPNKKIWACSPFAIVFNYNLNDADKVRFNIPQLPDNPSLKEKEEQEILIKKAKRNLVEENAETYKNNGSKIYGLGSNEIALVNAFYQNLNKILDAVYTTAEYSLITKDSGYIKIFLRTIPIEYQLSKHDEFVKMNIFNEVITNDKGSVSFFTSYSGKKKFLYHVTAPMKKGINCYLSVDDALLLTKFSMLAQRNVFPSLLPIVIDKKEINSEVIKVFNDRKDKIGYRELIESLFNNHNSVNFLQDFYLINIVNSRKGLVINDIDFVPQFRYALDNVIVHNVLESGYMKNNTFEPDKDEKIDNIFDFERVVVKTLFNNSLVRIKEDSYTTNYFGEVDPKYVNGGDIVYQLISKYRYCIYDYIYKSNTHAIDKIMFDDIAYQSILSNIKQDEIKTQRFSQNNTIKRKLNIWFSLDNLFTNKNTIMASSINELKNKMVEVANGDGDLTSNAEFAFAAGQLVSYLIDRSAAGNKNYSMLEPFLQKVNSGSLQDAIANSFIVYKHDIGVYKGKFEHIASQVFTYDGNIDIKPILKYFLAGCFSDCVIYIKN